MRRKETKTTGIEPYIIECMCLNISEKESLSYLKYRGYSISPAEFYRIKNQIKESTQERLNLIASEQFMAQHLERIDMLKTIQKELWANYHLEKLPTKKANILMQIAEIQQFLSSYYDSIQYVMQQAARHKQEKNEKSLS